MNISAINNNYTGFVQNSVSRSSRLEPDTATTEAAQKNNEIESKEENTQTDPAVNNAYNKELTQAELQIIQELEKTDANVRRHEMAHITSGGRYITSGASYSYQRGPDGKNYVIGGEVRIDTSPVPGDPEATIQKMRQIKNAALAPSDPSSQDLKVASQASQQVSKALSDLMMLEAEKRAKSNETKAFGNLQHASDSYVKVNNLPEEDTHSFQIAI